MTTVAPTGAWLGVSWVSTGTECRSLPVHPRSATRHTPDRAAGSAVPDLRMVIKVLLPDCTPARGLSQGPQHFQERLAVRLQLPGPHAADVQQALGRGGTERGPCAAGWRR